ncbi:tetratricopeptide repeat protein, partial [Candidatus Aerophobetes bacterium]|nr:tetratricopeptide repeat protein [Candidatus Aerophobetes bacterium]
MQNKGTLNDLRENIEKYKKDLLDLDQLGEKIVQTLILRDKICSLIHTLEQKKADLSVEKSKLDSLDHIIKDRPQVVWKRLKHYTDPVSYRKKHKIPTSSWWWYVDEIIKSEKRRAKRRWIKRGTIVAGVLISLYLVLTYAVPKPDPYTSSISEADRLLEEGKINPALEAYQRAMDIDPEKPTAYLMAGVIYGFLGEKETAEKHFTEAKKRSTSLHDFYLQRGMSWIRLGQFSAAQEDAEKAVEINPESAEAHFLLGNAYEAQGNIAKAIAHLSIVSDMDADPKLTVMAR